ncbi:MAG TPA: PQQ-binding-like beta-propeller repeat protein [Stellaceae bacterium]|nr:PQQ-binding-like beta-propeller repeat protein [Stellaceae bacterium]
MNKDYSSQRFVRLDQITPKNVQDLGEVCEIRLSAPTFFSSGLLKVDRTLYVNTYRTTYAIDATTCKLLWASPITVINAVTTNNSRGSAYLNGRLFRGTPDGALIALDAKTGKLLWTNRTAADPNAHEAFVSAPIAWNGKVFDGIAVGDAGIAGRLMAFDAKTGKELWHFDTTLGFSAGGAFWTTYSLDPTTGEVFGSVANPFPDFFRNGIVDMEVTRHTDSVISVDAAKGTLNWSRQAVPRDEHDWDLGAAPTLYRTSSGKSMVTVTGKSGRVYGFDRTTHLSVFDTPATTMENDQVPLTPSWMHVCPGLQGGAQFNGTAFDPRTGTLFVGMGDHCAWFFTDPLAPNATNGGGVAKDWAAVAKQKAPRGWITAINATTGAVLWTYQTKAQVQAGLVPTSSGLLFAGDTRGNLMAFDASNGNLLKNIDTGGALNDGLISYSVGGKQYVAATVGGATENPSTVAGALRVSIYSLRSSGKPTVITLPRLPQDLPGATPGSVQFFQNCSQCHGFTGDGSSAPPIRRQSQLADPALLKQFLETVPPPMPRLFPGVLSNNDVVQIAAYLKTNVFLCDTPTPPQSCAAPPKPSSGGTAAWRAIYTDLTSPRCLNCHPKASRNLDDFYGFKQDYPRQGDDRHPHYWNVVRGDTFRFPTAENPNVTVRPGMGPPFERCTSCHGAANDPVTGIPGTSNNHVNPGQPFWALAPSSMAWEATPGIALSGPKLCANLLDKKLNGQRTPPELLKHIQTEPLVLWAFAPGKRPNGQQRTTPPISHNGLVAAFKEWIAEGTPCPAK